MASKKAGNGEKRKIQGKEDDRKSLRGCQGAAGWKRSATEVRTGWGSEKKNSKRSAVAKTVRDPVLGVRKTGLPSGGHSAVEPPGPIPNPEVKRRSADGSGTIGPVRVGRRQV